MKQRTTWLVAALLVLALTACGEEKAAINEIGFQSAPAYTAEDAALPVETGELTGCCTDGAYMYILADEEAGEDVRSVLCRVRLADGTVEVLDGYQASNAPEDAAISRLGPLLAPDGTLWLYETWYISHFDLPEDFDGETDLKGNYLDYQEEFHHLRQLDPVTGQQKSVVDLSNAVRALSGGSTFDEANAAVDGEGNIYFAWNGGIAVLDREGACLFTLEADMPASAFASAGGRLALLPDGTVAALVTLPGGKREVRTIDPAKQDWGQTLFTVSNEVGVLYSGRGACLFYYISGDVLYGVAEGDVIPQRLLSLADTRLDGYSGTVCFALLDEGRAAVLLRTTQSGGGPYEAHIRLALLSPADQLPEDGKIKLVYGAIGNDSYIQNRINQFNKESDIYCIEYRDYAEGSFATMDGMDEYYAIQKAARLRLQGEIAAGRAPDIMGSTLPLEIYANAGYLEDLWPWIDSDPEISREGLMAHVLECAEKEGKLYTIGGGFTIETAAASRTAAGDRTGWTLEEMLDAYGGTMPDVYWGQAEYLYKCNAEDTLWQLLVQDMERYVDWETGECRFDSGDFKDLLRLAASSGNGERSYEASTPLLWESEPVLCKVILSEPKDLVAWDVYFGGPEALTDGAYEQQLWEAGVLYTFISDQNGQECTTYHNAAFAGAMQSAREGVFGRNAAGAAFGMPDRDLYASFPGSPTGNGAGSCFVLQDQMAVSASSQAKEGAWAFVRSLLLPGGYLHADSIEGNSYTLASGFPINSSDFEALMEPRWCRVEGDGEIIPDKNGQPIEAPVNDMPIRIGNPIVLAAYQMAPTQAQMDRFWALYNAIEHVSVNDRDLMQIIQEQAQPYFAGDKDLDETADLIQRRMTLYVNENR